MITKIIEILQTQPFYNLSEEVEIAKGKYEYVTTFKAGFNKIKRQIKYKK
jgi:hypothetical protein